MKKTVVMTGVGQDRVGIVAELTETLFSLGCNLLDSSMTLLRGEFALILMAQLPENLSLKELEDNLHNIKQKMNFAIHVRELTAQELIDEPWQGDACIISVYGADKPGIVSGITTKLAELGANITDVETKSTRDTGNPIFLMILEVTLAKETAAKDLERALLKTGQELGVDVTVKPIEVLEL